MAIGMLTALRTSRAEEIIALIDAGTTGGKVKLYGGGSGRPATGAAVTDQTLLVTLTFSDPCGTVTNGVLTFNALTSGTAVGTGTANWARITDSADTFVMDMDVGATGSGSDIEMNSTSVETDGTVEGTATRTITEGNA